MLLDNCVEVAFRALISGHDMAHVRDVGWRLLQNGALLSAAEADGFEVFVTVDKNMRHQQSFARHTISLIVLNSLFTAIDDIAPLAPRLQALLDAGVAPGSVTLIDP